MQQHRVISWLSEHNFPHGLISFACGLTTDPLRYKAQYLKTLQQEASQRKNVKFYEKFLKLIEFFSISIFYFLRN